MQKQQAGHKNEVKPNPPTNPIISTYPKISITNYVRRLIPISITYGEINVDKSNVLYYQLRYFSYKK